MLQLCCKCWEERVAMALRCFPWETSSGRVAELLASGGLCWLPSAAAAVGKSAGANQNLLLLCLSPDMDGVGYRGMLHDQFCTFGAYTIHSKFEIIHLHAHLSLVLFSLFMRGTKIYTSRLLSLFLSIWLKGL